MARKNDFTLYGSVQEKSGRLYLTYRHYDPVKKERKVKWVSMGLTTADKKSVIEKKKRQMLAELEKEELRCMEGYNNPEYYPLVKYLSEWLDTVHRKKIQALTYDGYKKLIDGKISDYFGHKTTLDDCTPKAIHNFYESLRESGATERTVLHYHNLLHVAFEYAVKQEIFEINPMVKVDRPQPKKYVGKFYTPEEVQTLLAFAEDDTIYIPIVMAAYYGLRRSEIVGLSWDCIDFDTNEIHIIQKAYEESNEIEGAPHSVQISEQLKNNSSRRTLPLLPEVRDILIAHKAKQEKQRKEFRNGYKKDNLNMICLTPVGELIKPNYVTTHFPKLLEKYGLRQIRFHDLRHTCASMMLSQNIHMKVIQTWLGHSNMSTTADIYSHLESKSKIEAGNVINTLLTVEREG